MSSAYKLTVGDKSYGPESGVISRIEVEERREKHAITTLTAEFIDPEWKMFGEMKDPAFTEVPVELYLQKAGEARAAQTLCFQGKVTTLAAGYPDRRTLVITAHDKSIDLRRRKTLGLFKNKNAVQVAKAIATSYGFEVDTSQVDDLIAGLVLREIDSGITPNLSDWDHLQRALSADGFVAVMRKNKIYVTRAPSVAYGTTFHRDKYPVISFNVTIQHVRGPGKQGDVRGTVWMEGTGTQRAIRDAQDKKRADKEKADARTPRRPVAGPEKSSSTKSHAEDVKGSDPASVVEQLRERKDTAQLIIFPAPDLSVLNNVRLADWGAKVDGTWFAESVKHVIASDSSAVTAVGLVRGASPGALKGAQLT